MFFRTKISSSQTFEHYFISGGIVLWKASRDAGDAAFVEDQRLLHSRTLLQIIANIILFELFLAELPQRMPQSHWRYIFKFEKGAFTRISMSSWNRILIHQIWCFAHDVVSAFTFLRMLHNRRQFENRLFPFARFLVEHGGNHQRIRIRRLRRIQLTPLFPWRIVRLY